MAYIGGDIAATGTGAVPTALAQVQPPSGTTSSNAGTSDPANSGPKQGQPSAYAWLLAWAVLLATLTLINRTKLGHAAIYYGLVLMLVFVILSNYRFVQTALNPFSSLTAQ